jgi:hypothetical protein
MLSFNNQILRPPEMDSLGEEGREEEGRQQEGRGDILSVTPFYSFTAEGGGAVCKDAEIKVPTPPDFQDSGEILVFSVNVDVDGDENTREDDWEVLQTSPYVVNNRIIFAVSSFSMYVP